LGASCPRPFVPRLGATQFVELEVWIKRHEPGPERRQVEHAEAQWRIDPESSARLRSVEGDGRLGLGDVLQNLADPLIECSTALGQGELARGPVQQPGSERLLKLLDIAGHVGRRGVERIRRTGEISVRDNGRENLECTKTIHAAIIQES
jgi:hypothetical protein